MNKNKNINNIDAIMQEIAKITRNDVLAVSKEYDNILRENKKSTREPDMDFIKFAKKYDKNNALMEKQAQRKKILRVAATIIICTCTISFATIGFAEALNIPLFNITFNKHDNSLLLTPSESEILKDLEDYYYPEFTPESFLLIEADDYFGQKTITFQSVENDVLYRITENDTDTEMGIDTSTNNLESVSVGIYKGYYAIDTEYESEILFWLTDDRLFFIYVEGYLGKDVMIQVAESLKYKE